MSRTSRVRELIREIHRRSLWQVLTIYLVGSWVAYQVVVSLTEGLDLPEWFPPFAVVLFVMGLPIVLATAFIQEGIHHHDEGSPEAERRVPTEAGKAPTEIGPEAARTSPVTDAGQHTGASTAPGRLFTWRRVLLGGVAAAAVWGVVAAGWLLFGDQRDGGFPPLPGEGPGMVARGEVDDRQAVAVLPFRVMGAADSEAVWQEGIADLLAMNLERVAGLRKVDPRTVLSYWRRSVGDEGAAPDADAVLQVARDVGATYALTGTMIGRESQVRLAAQVYDLRSSDPRGTAQVDGPADSVITLVDRLSIEILRSGLLLDAVDLPRLDLSGITTRSMAALRAYLQGEKDYRRGRWPEAIAHFQDAVAADSGFALASFRLGMSHSWSPTGRYDIAVRSLERAHRYQSRLPEREALLVEGALQFLRGEPDAVETLEDLAIRYPDDVDAWTLLGDAIHRQGPQRLIPRDRFRRAHRRAIELNPYFGPPYVPLMWDAFYRRDSVALRDLLDGFRHIDSEVDYCVGFETAYAFLWGTPEERAHYRAIADTVYSDALTCAAMGMQRAGEMDDRVRQLVRDARDRYGPSSFRVPLQALRAGLNRTGRIREARGVILEMAQDYPLTSGIHLLRLHMRSYPDPATRDRGRALLEGDGGVAARLWLGLLAVHEGRRAEAVRMARELESMETDGEDPIAELQARAGRLHAQTLRAYLGAAEDGGSETLQALADQVARLPGVGPGNSATPLMRYELARLFLASGRAADAEALLRSFNYADPADLATDARRLRARALESLDREEEARREYGRYLELMADADPELQDRVRDARSRLEALETAPPAATPASGRLFPDPPGRTSPETSASPGTS